MKISDAALDYITKPFEGLRLKAYPDPQSGGDPWTIGWGHTQGVKRGDTCTPEQALTWLHQDVAWAESVANKITTQLTQNQFDAVVDFIYNVGSGNFNSSTMKKKLNLGDLPGAGLEFNKWVRNALPGTIIRRQKETDWYYGKVDTA